MSDEEKTMYVPEGKAGTADVVVVGGGVIGCATAYDLARRGLSVIVLDRDESLGNGASSRNGGGVRQSGRDARELPLAIYAVQNIWPGLSEELGTDVEYMRQGNLRLGKTEHHLEILRGLAKVGCESGLDMRMLDADEVRSINPYLSDEVIGASWCPTDGHANPMRTTLAFYRRARQLGARFVSGVEVLGLRKSKGRVREVLTSVGRFGCDHVVLAAGLGSRGIAETVGVDIPMHGLLIEALVTEAQPTMFPQMLGTADADFYGHQTAHGSFVFGGDSGLEESNGQDGGVPTSSITAPAVCRSIMKYVPRLADAKIVRTWSGWEDESVDGVPVISNVDEAPGLTLACAFTGHGFGIAPIVGRLVGELVCEEPTSVDIAPLRYDRFHAWA
jgi:sarcosine oxidase subunit beta